MEGKRLETKVVERGSGGRVKGRRRRNDSGGGMATTEEMGLRRGKDRGIKTR